MTRRLLTLLISVVALVVAANAFADTYPQRIAAQYDSGWDVAYWSANEIDTSTKDSTWEEYYTSRISFFNVNAIFARVGKWGGSSDTDVFASYADWYMEELENDTLYQSCPSGHLATFGKTGELLCDSVDYPGESNNVLDTCWDNNGVSHSCRRYQMGEYGAYDDNTIYTSCTAGGAFCQARYAVMRFKYSSTGSYQYRSFMIHNILT